MDGFRRRFNRWNEAKIDPYFEENVLDLMQGKTISCNIKYEAPQPLPLLDKDMPSIFNDPDKDEPQPSTSKRAKLI
jgi:hypothetical protein